MKLTLDRPLAFLDLETTGINITHDRIIEMAIIKENPNGSVDKKEIRVNPTIPIPKESTEIHGISDADVEGLPTFADEAGTIALFLTDCDLAGYNSNRFDVPLLVEEFLRANINFDLEGRRLLDVQRIFHMMERRDLTAAYKFYCEKDLVDAHSAMADTQATYEVLHGQLDRYPTLSNNVDELVDFTGEMEFVDLGRRMIKKNGKVLFNFGKHKDKEVSEVLAKEPQYYNWIMQSDFLLHTKQKLTEIWEKSRKG
jgi:DNA polymerase-3 subunit epsilon